MTNGEVETVEGTEVDELSDAFVARKPFECDARCNLSIETKLNQNGKPYKIVTVVWTPTSYDGDDMKDRYYAFQGKPDWSAFGTAVRKLGFKTMQELLKMSGKEFHLKKIRCGSRTDQTTGERLPVFRLIPQHEKVTPQTTITGSVEAPKPPAPSEPPKMTEDENKVLEFLKRTGGGTNVNIANGLGLKIPAVVKCTNGLVSKSLIKEEEGVYLLA